MKETTTKVRPAVTILLIHLLAILIFTACEPKKKKNGTPTPSPTPGSSTTPTPTPNSGTGACLPAPPPLAKMQPVFHGNKLNGDVVLDVTPKVCDSEGTWGYCENVWAGERRNCCPTRPEGDPLRVVCENQVLGMSDHGHFGPTWSMESGSGTVRPAGSNPYLAYVTPPGGVVSACGNVPDGSGEVVCGSITITPNMFKPPQ